MLGIRKGMVPSACASVRLKNGGPARMASTERVVVTEILDKIFAELGGNRESACLLALSTVLTA